MWTKIHSLLFFIFFMSFSMTQASQDAGVILMVNGSAEVFVKPSSQPNGPGPRVKFEGQYYQIKPAKLGMRVKWNEVIRTSATAKVKVSFKNGDAIFVGPGTAYSLNENLSANSKNKKEKPKQVLNLIYGKMRAVVSKKGPRNNLQIKTHSAVAGVRGTDFYVSYSPASSHTEYSVLRGAVQVKPKSAHQPVHVKSGQHVVVKHQPQLENKPKNALPDKAEAPQVVDLYKEKLMEIQKSSHLERDESSLNELTEEKKQEFVELEKQHKNVVLEDIQLENKELYEKVKDKENFNADHLNSSVVAHLYKQAPKLVEKNKVSEEDLKDLWGEEVYKHYK